MKIRITIATAFMLMCAAVSAQFMTVELAHEVSLSEFVVPVSQNGSLNFRACSDCKSFTARLTPRTRYIINNKDVELQEFRQRLGGVHNRDEHALTILQHLETNTVTYISISL